MNVTLVNKPMRLIRWIAGALPVISAVYVVVLDPDPLGIAVAFFILLFLYLAFRTKLVGSILLVILGSSFLLQVLYHVITSEQGIDWSGTLNAIVLGLLNLTAGILFIIIARAIKRIAS